MRQTNTTPTLKMDKLRPRCFLIAAGGRVFRFQGAKPSTPAEAGPR